MILKWHLFGLHGDIKEVLKSEGKLGFTQYQEYYTVGMERKTLAVRILAVVSNQAVIPPQVCMLLYHEKAVYGNVYHKMYAVIQQILGRMELKRQSNKSIFGHDVLTFSGVSEQFT